MVAATPPTSIEHAAARLRIGSRGAALLLVAVALVAAHQAGVLRLFADPARATQAIVELGPWGYVAFVMAYAALQPFGVSGTLFVVVATLIWPWPLAAISWFGEKLFAALRHAPPTVWIALGGAVIAIVVALRFRSSRRRVR